MVVPTLDAGGAERLLADLAATAGRHGVAAGVLLLTERSFYPLPDEVPLFRGVGRRIRLGAALRGLRDAVRRFRPRLLHSFMHQAGFVTSLGRRLGRPLPHLQTVQSFIRDDWSARDRWMARISYADAAAVTACSEGLRAFLAERFPRQAARFVHVPNAIAFDVEQLGREQARLRLSLDPDQPLVVTVGRLLAAVKGQDVVVDALAALRAAVPNARLALVGDGSDRAQLESRARRLGLAEHVLFAGMRSDVPVWMAAADVVAVPSRSEAFGLVAAEAGRARRPVVGSRVGGLVEIVEEGASGALVPPGDAAALAAALAGLLTDPARAAAWGERGHAIARERFSIEGYWRALLPLYERLAG
jgi:glycosyltransferase involved in cell wall biosynthesis